MRDPGSIPTSGNILSLDFFGFQAVKTKMPILAFAYICNCIFPGKVRLTFLHRCSS